MSFLRRDDRDDGMMDHLLPKGSTALAPLQPIADFVLVYEVEAKAALAELAKGYDVTSQADVDQLSSAFDTTHGYLKEIEAERERDTRPEVDALENKRAYYRGAHKALTSVKDQLRVLIRDGIMKLQREAEAALAAAAAQQDTEAIASVEAPTASKVSVRHKRTYRIVDESAIPRRFLMVNHAALAIAIDAGEEVPGVFVENSIDVHAKARRNWR